MNNEMRQSGSRIGKDDKENKSAAVHKQFRKDYSAPGMKNMPCVPFKMNFHSINLSVLCRAFLLRASTATFIVAVDMINKLWKTNDFQK